MKKQLIAAITAAATITSAVGGISVGAFDEWSYSEDLTVYVNGTKIDNGEYKPIIANDRTLVRLVPVFEALGYSSTDGSAEAGYYSFTEEDKSISFVDKGTNATYTFIAESPFAIVGTGGGSQYNLDVPATLQYFDVFYVPIRSFCEMANLDIEWDNSTRSVYIGSKPQVDIPQEKTLLTYEEAKKIAENYVNDSDILLGGNATLIAHNGRQAYAFVLRSKSMVENGGSGTMGMTVYVYADNGEIDSKEEVPGSEINNTNNVTPSTNDISSVIYGTSGLYMNGDPGEEITYVYCAAGYDVNSGKSIVGQYLNKEITVEEVAQFSQKNHNTNHTSTGLMIQKALDMIKAAYGVEITGTAKLYSNCVTAMCTTGSEFKSFGVSYSGDNRYYVAASTAEDILESGNDKNSTVKILDEDYNVIGVAN